MNSTTRYMPDQVAGHKTDGSIARRTWMLDAVVPFVAPAAVVTGRFS